MSHIDSDIQNGLKELLLSLCSKGLKDRANKNFYFDRLPLIITNKNTALCFLSDSQKKNKDSKVWTNTDIIDLCVKGLTMDNKTYLQSIAKK